MGASAELVRFIRESGLARYRQYASMAAAAAAKQISEAVCRAHLQYWWAHPPSCVRRPILLPPPPEPDEWRAAVRSDFTIGALSEVEGLRIGGVLGNKVEHWAFSGSTGFGKTVGIRGLALQVAAWARAEGRPISIVGFDQKGGDLSDFTAILGSPCQQRSAHQGRWFGLNPPVGMPIHLWSSILSMILAGRCGLKFGATTIARMITWLASHLNPQPQEPLLCADFRLLRDLAVTAPPTLFAAKQAYDQSVVQILDGLAHAAGPVAETFNGLDLQRDVIDHRESVVFDLSALSAPLRPVLIDVLLAQLLFGRLHRQHKVDQVEVVILFDESDLDVTYAANACFPEGQSPLARLLRQGRELGIMCVLGINILGYACPAILNNLQNLVLLRQESAESITLGAHTLLLPRGAEALLPALNPGEAVVRVAGWPDAVLAQLDYVAPRR